MKTLATLHAKQLYDVIRFPADPSGERIPDPDGRGREPVLTLHTQCGFSFFSFFGSRGFPQGYRSECDRYTCPRCGKLLINLVRGNEDTFYTSYNGRYVPTNTDLYLIEGKDFVDVNMTFDSVSAANEYYLNKHGRSYACIRYDFKKRRTIYSFKPHRSIPDYHELLTPGNDLAVFRFNGDYKDYACTLRGEGRDAHYAISLFATPFLFLGLNTRLWKDSKTDVRDFTKKLVNAFKRHLETSVGGKVLSPYVPLTGGVSGWGGIFNNLLRNMAWRMLYPDAPNLTKEDLGTVLTARSSDHPLGPENKLTPIDRMHYYLIDMGAKGLAYKRALEAVTDVSLNKPLLAAIKKQPIKKMVNLKDVVKIFKAPEHQGEVAVHLLESINFYYDPAAIRNGLHLVRLMAMIKGEAKAYNFVINNSWTNISDSNRMYFQMSRTWRRRFWSYRIKSKDVHDWLVRAVTKMGAANVKMTMQTKGMQYLADDLPDGVISLATDSHTLTRWGSLFHNCAGTYKDRVKDCKAVVLAYFVKGQAKVCIEVNPKRKAIVQAKLPCNRIVGEDPETLTIIKNWARRKRLAVATLDMEEVTAANAN